jgi:hypothetical protein
VIDDAAPGSLAETLYLALADVAGLPADRREQFSFYCAAASEFVIDGRCADSVALLEAAVGLSGRDLEWLRVGCAAIRDEMVRRGVAHPHD